jgi:hypothetical protein
MAVEKLWTFVKNEFGERFLADHSGPNRAAEVARGYEEKCDPIPTRFNLSRLTACTLKIDYA